MYAISSVMVLSVSSVCKSVDCVSFTLLLLHEHKSKATKKNVKAIYFIGFLLKFLFLNQ